MFFAFIVLFFIMALPESPKYMYANRRFDEARSILKIIAKHNQVEAVDDVDKIVFQYEVSK